MYPSCWSACLQHRVRELPCQHWPHSGSNCYRETEKKNNFGNVYSTMFKLQLALTFGNMPFFVSCTHASSHLSAAIKVEPYKHDWHSFFINNRFIIMKIMVRFNLYPSSLKTLARFSCRSGQSDRGKWVAAWSIQ